MRTSPAHSTPATELGTADVEAVAVPALVGVHRVEVLALSTLDLPGVLVGLGEGGEPALLAPALVPAQDFVVGHAVHMVP
jgi:hypothetical protein